MSAQPPGGAAILPVTSAEDPAFFTMDPPHRRCQPPESPHLSPPEPWVCTGSLPGLKLREAPAADLQQCAHVWRPSSCALAGCQPGLSLPMLQPRKHTLTARTPWLLEGLHLGLVQSLAGTTGLTCALSWLCPCTPQAGPHQQPVLLCTALGDSTDVGENTNSQDPCSFRGPLIGPGPCWLGPPPLHGVSATSPSGHCYCCPGP